MHQLIYTLPTIHKITIITGALSRQRNGTQWSSLTKPYSSWPNNEYQCSISNSIGYRLLGHPNRVWEKFLHSTCKSRAERSSRNAGPAGLQSGLLGQIIGNYNYVNQLLQLRLTMSINEPCHSWLISIGFNDSYTICSAAEACCKPGSVGMHGCFERNKPMSTIDVPLAQSAILITDLFCYSPYLFTSVWFMIISQSSSLHAYIIVLAVAWPHKVCNKTTHCIGYTRCLITNKHYC